MSGHPKRIDFSCRVNGPHYLLLAQEAVLKVVFESVSAGTEFGQCFTIFRRAIARHHK